MPEMSRKHFLFLTLHKILNLTHMKLFRKSAPEENKPNQPTVSLCPEEKTTYLKQELSAEEAARQWFAGQFGTEMPEEITRLFRKIAQAEVQRQKAGEQLLDENALKRLQDAIRLNKTKLRNITQTLEGLQAQKEWYHKFKELNSTQEKFRQAFFESNKNYNAHLREIKELERFEAFEEVIGNYQRIKTKENLLLEVREKGSQHSAQLFEAQNTDKEKQRQAESCAKKLKEDLHHLQIMQRTLQEGYRLLTILELDETNLKDLDIYQTRIERMLATNAQRDNETKEELEECSKQAAREQLLKQNLESHQKMLEKGEAILVRLSFLLSFKVYKEQLQKEIEQTQKKQQEQDEKLYQLFLESKNIDAQINTLHSELQVHQKSIVGMNSYNLQQRAINLKSRQEMLTNATKLWKKIADGYSRVDETGQEIMRMRHHHETLKAQIAQLEPEITGLQTQCEELKYAYTLSKSQDVMQLRNDLQEGVSCSVCGATHHPYHSDTLLEQSQLIGGIKRDFEQTTTNLKNKQDLLNDLKQELATEGGRIEMEHKALDTYKQILQEDVSHWETFVHLDRSFKDCSASTNFEGRRIMLQQLAEKNGLDAEEAQKELDTFNFHQSNINSINEEIARKELGKNSLTVRLNEVNTGCQVIAYRLEQLRQELTHINSQFSELFEETDRMMTLANWYKVWLENPENIRIYIQQHMEQWFNLKTEMSQTANRLTRLQTQQEMLRQQAQTLEKQRNMISEKIEQLHERNELTRNQLHKLFPNGEVEACNKELLDRLQLSEEQQEKVDRQAQEAHAASAYRQGYTQRMTDTVQELEAQIAKERSELDVWIRKYNAAHSPVQFSELEQIFNSATDWNAIRKEIRELKLQNLLAEARVNETRVALAAHQVNAFSQGQETEDRTAALNTEIARLESEQEQIRTHIAGYQAKLDAHELCLQKQTERTASRPTF